MKLFSTLTLLAASTTTLANAKEPQLYGTITLNSGESVTGALRWADEETFLSDMYNGRKADIVGRDMLSKDQLRELLDKQPGPKTRVLGIEITFKKFFDEELDKPYVNIPFGNIKQVSPNQPEGHIKVELKDGTVHLFAEGSNDLDQDVRIMDSQGQVKEYDQSDIKSITFSSNQAQNQFGSGIYGTVETTFGKFSGRIQWDHDERLSNEKLDGNADDGREHEILFEQIKRIENRDTASQVTLNDDTSLLLKGTNDVNHDNRGIYIDTPEGRRIDVPWRNFLAVDFHPVGQDWQVKVDQQNQIKPLSGTVKLKDGNQIKTDQLIYNLNQQSQGEMLYTRMESGIQFIPLYLVNQIKPVNTNTSSIQLKDGTTITAFDTNDVGTRGHGVLVKENNKHRLISWDQVDVILLD